MKKILMLSLLLLGVATMLCSARCDKSKFVDGPFQAPDSIRNPKIAPDDDVTAFRYERYEVGKGKRSEVFYMKKGMEGNKVYFYFRPWDSRTATSYDALPLQSALDELGKAALDLRLASYPQTSLDKEDKSRSRWMVKIVYQSSKTVEVVEYSQEPRTADDQRIGEVLESIFRRAMDRIGQEGMKSEHTRYTYDGEGNLEREMYYTEDGVVHGGHNPSDPTLDY